MDITQALPLLGGLSPRQFMKRHWQKRPLLVRGAVPGFRPLLSRTEPSTIPQDAPVDTPQDRPEFVGDTLAAIRESDPDDVKLAAIRWHVRHVRDQAPAQPQAPEWTHITRLYAEALESIGNIAGAS